MPTQETTAEDRTADRTLNPKILNDLREIEAKGSSNLVARVIDAYLGKSPALLATILEAVEQDDPESLAKAAHSLKSSSANLGAETLWGQCRAIEALCCEQTTKGRGELAAEIEDEFARVCAALQEERGKGA